MRGVDSEMHLSIDTVSEMPWFIPSGLFQYCMQGFYDTAVS